MFLFALLSGLDRQQPAPYASRSVGRWARNVNTDSTHEAAAEFSSVSCERDRRESGEMSRVGRPTLCPHSPSQARVGETATSHRDYDNLSKSERTDKSTLVFGRDQVEWEVECNK